MRDMENMKRNISPTKKSDETSIKKPRILSELSNSNQRSLNADNYEKFIDENDFIFDESFDCEFESNKNRLLLNENEFVRCVVEKVEPRKFASELVLTVKAEKIKYNENINGTETEVAVCYLKGPWSHTLVHVGDVISLKCQWHPQLNAYVVDKDQGFIVTNADTLISGTTVVGSLFCRRKAVLQDRFGTIDAQSSVMVIGSMVHELLQSVLEKGLETEQQIKSLANHQLSSQKTAYELYGCFLTTDQAEEKVLEFVPRIRSFVRQYITKNNTNLATTQAGNFQGKINEIQDIEENLWLPQLGLKGKVDATVRIQRTHHAKKTTLPIEEDYVPLEIKTGRATFSMEHKGQLILYQMMLNSIGKKTSTGLLLYISDNIIREIDGGRNEQRDLIMLRNELSYYLTKVNSISKSNKPLKSDDCDKFQLPLQLPEPIQHPRACSKCAYAGLCCTFAKNDADLELEEDHPLNEVMVNEISHLNMADFDYFMRWFGLLLLEEQEAKMSNNLRALWTETAEKRQNDGRAVIDLILMNNVIAHENRYSHTFNLEQTNVALHNFAIGEYVIISIRKRLAIATGFITDITKFSVVISLERDLRKSYEQQKFILDKYESLTGNKFNYTNLGILLQNNTRAQQLREIIVQKTLPKFAEFDKKFNVSIYQEILTSLNLIQRSAALKALHAVDYLLIKGLPGTGKTQTLVAIIRMLHALNKSVLVTSHTNSAVDNIFLRLKTQGLPLLRLGSNARIHKNLHECSEFEIMKDCHKVEELIEKYKSYPIVGVTCLGTAHDIFLYRKFDICIMDEATQVMQPTSLRPLFYCEKFVLVGDPNQLPPLVRSKEARQRGADESLFHHLDALSATVSLRLQYRMNKTINKLANDLTYGDQLICATNELKLATINVNQEIIDAKPKWLQHIMHVHIDQAVIFVDTLNCVERSYQFANIKNRTPSKVVEEKFALTEESSITPKKTRLFNYTNYAEAAIIFQIVKMLLNAKYDPTRVGIIAPYRAQVDLLRKLLNQIEIYFEKKQEILRFGQIEVNTVDQYQGRDKDIIIYSCTKTGAADMQNVECGRNLEILEDQRRLTVAVTRAKLKLIIIGDATCLRQYKPYEKLMRCIPNMCKLQLGEKFAFSWHEIFEDLRKVIDTE